MTTVNANPPEGVTFSKPKTICGHEDREVYSLQRCRSCYEKDLRKRNPEFAQRQRENTQRWLTVPGNLERKQKVDRLRLHNPDSSRRYHMLHKYGITQEEYEALLFEQGGGCALCGKTPEENGKRLAVDHDHRCCEGTRSCGVCVRGLLCGRCNLGLAFFYDEAETLVRAAAYVNERAFAWD